MLLKKFELTPRAGNRTLLLDTRLVELHQDETEVSGILSTRLH